MNVKRILLAVDGSVHSEHARDAAIDLAEKYGAGIMVVHGYESMPAIDDSQFLGDVDEINKTMARRAQSFVDEVAGNIPGVEVTTRTVNGNIAEGIAELAEKEGCGMIVMGSRGLSDFKGLLLGSMAHKVLQLAKCPVLIAR